jgi:hypothetical protein
VELRPVVEHAHAPGVPLPTVHLVPVVPDVRDLRLAVLVAQVRFGRNNARGHRAVRQLRARVLLHRPPQLPRHPLRLDWPDAADAVDAQVRRVENLGVRRAGLGPVRIPEGVLPVDDVPLLVRLAIHVDRHPLGVNRPNLTD